MTIQEQIQKDIAWVSENSGMQSRLLDVLKTLKVHRPAQRNIEKVLANAGKIDSDSAEEITQIVNNEFGKIDGDWK